MNLIIQSASREAMETDARKCFPDECCGFFFGHHERENRVVTHAYAVQNAKEGDKRRRFAISALDYMKAEQYALEQGLALLGVYHSHPLHPAIPSEHDLAVAQPVFSYIILNVTETGVGHIRSWQLNSHRQFEEEPISYA